VIGPCAVAIFDHDQVKEVLWVFTEVKLDSILGVLGDDGLKDAEADISIRRNFSLLGNITRGYS
jgi:hypothetical protein